LIEILAVVTILLLLATLILVAVGVARDIAKNLKARRDVAQLKTALEAYYGDYGTFPDITETDSISGDYYITGTTLIQTLRGREGVKNPKRVAYMDFHQKTTTFNDPWGNKYRVSMDTNLGGTAYDGEVFIPGGSGTVRKSVVAWSAGKDGVDGTDDDVRTWRE
jgi:type II secretory pathway pseudopilin PulG